MIAMVGGHVVKTGLTPLFIDSMRRRVITHVAMNGSAAIHDYEMARFGATSEDVARGLLDGRFGMAEETGRGMNQAVNAGAAAEWGMGEVAGARARADAGPPAPRVVSPRGLAAARRPGHCARRDRRRDHPSAPGRRRRGAGRDQSPGFSATRGDPRQRRMTGASYSILEAPSSCRRSFSRR